MIAVYVLAGLVTLYGGLVSCVYLATRNTQATQQVKELDRERRRLRTAIGAVYEYAWHDRDAVPELFVVCNTIESIIGPADEIIVDTHRKELNR